MLGRGAGGDTGQTQPGFGTWLRCFLPAICVVFGPTTALVVHAQTLYPILSNGPASNRFNIVFLSEGYTSAQLTAFRTDATNALNALLGRAPYSAYSPCINAWAIAVASVQSGSDHPADPSYRQTYFNSSYDAVSDHLVTIPPNAFDSNYANGQGKVDALLSAFFPRCHLPVLLVNDLRSGGSDGGGVTAIVSRGAEFADLLAHESGHVVANLGDEYTTANPGYPDTEEPNTTRATNNIKWAAWIPAGTPTPTPPTAAYESAVGLFEGAHYHATGWYRPKLNCTMNSPTFPEFCEVCREALVLAFYRAFRPVDSWTPSATNLVSTSAQDASFSLQLANPAAALVQWFTNGLQVSGATNATCTVSPRAMGNGSHTVTVRVSDRVSWVRSDPANLLSQTVAWTLHITVPELRLDAVQMLADGRLVFRISGAPGTDFIIQSSTEFADPYSWTNLSTNRLTDSTFWITNAPPSGAQNRFYRALLQP